MPVDDVYTVALLHMDGSDASTTFLDESGKTWTQNDSAQIDTAQSKFGGASGLFDGVNDYISAPDSADWQFDSGSNTNEWTVDFWVRFNGAVAAQEPFFDQYVDNNNEQFFWKNNNTLNYIVKSGGTIIVNVSFAWTPSGDTWYHIALVKQGTTGYKCFVDGTQVGSTTTDTDTIPNFAASLRIGVANNQGVTTYYLDGWLDEFRISKGVARWTANFTPPTQAYAGASGNFLALF